MEVGLEQYPGKPGASRLASTLRARFASTEQKRALAQLLSLIEPANQPADAIAALLGEADNAKVLNATIEGAGVGYGETAPELRIANLKQECGEVTSADGAPLAYERYPIGSLLAIAPFHSCASTQQHQQVHVLAADGRTVVETWPICKGW